MSPAYVQCNHCGKSIQVSLSRLAKGRGRYCSRTCGNAARQDDGAISVSTLFSAAACPQPDTAPDRGPNKYTGQYTDNSPGEQLPSFGPNSRQPEDSASYGERFLSQPFYSRGSNHYWSKRVQRRRPKRIRESGVYFQRQSYSLVQCPWETGVLGPVRYDSDFICGPDPMLGF